MQPHNHLTKIFWLEVGREPKNGIKAFVGPLRHHRKMSKSASNILDHPRTFHDVATERMVDIIILFNVLGKVVKALNSSIDQLAIPGNIIDTARIYIQKIKNWNDKYLVLDESLDSLSH